MLTRRITLAGLAAAATISGSGAVFAQQASEFDKKHADLIQKAKAEGQVTWYEGLLESAGRAFSAHFQQRFGIRVQHQPMSSGAINERFRAESNAGRHIGDVLSLPDTIAMIEAIKANYIAQINVDSKSAFPKGWIIDQPNGTAYPVLRVGMTLAYNTQTLKPADVALLSSWKGLLDRRLADGVVGLGHPARSITALPIYYYWTRTNKAEYGLEFLNKLEAQKPIVYNSHTEEGARLAAGEVSVGMLPDLVAIQQYNLGAPIAMVYPSPTPLLLYYTSVSRNAPHPNAALLFLEYITSDEGMAEWKKAAGGLTGRPDVDERVKSKFVTEPWYRAPEQFFVIEDWDAAIKDYKAIMAEWTSVFQKR
jgi:iron(III) transport system substrate-binding protein